MNPVRRLYHWLVVPPNPFRFDPRCEALVDRLCSHARRGAPILNLGSGATRYGTRVVNLDLRPFPGVQLCGDGERLPFRSGVFTGVLLRGVLEHVRSAEAVRAEALRVLADGGFVYVEVPFLQPFHASPEDYRRFTLPGITRFLSEFEQIESGVQIGPGSSLAWVARVALASIFSLGSRRLYDKILVVAGWSTFWLKYLDRVVVPAPHVFGAASAFYFLGKKRG